MTRYRTSKKSLRIRDVEKNDSGRFTCKGINGFGKEEIKIDLIIIDPLDFPGLAEGALPEVFLQTPNLPCLNNNYNTPPGDPTYADQRHSVRPNALLKETGGDVENLLRGGGQAEAKYHVVQERPRVVGERAREARQVRAPRARAHGQRLWQVEETT